MLKIRLQGTKNDIRWLVRLFQRDKRFEVQNVSTFFDNVGTDKEMMSVDFVKSDDIDFDGVDQVADQAVRYEIKNNRNEVLDKSDISTDAKAQLKDAAKKQNPKKDKSLSDKIKDKKDKSQQKQQDKNRQREKSKKKNRDTSL